MKYALLTLLAATVVNPVLAWNDPYNPYGSNMSQSDSSNQYPYKSSSGTQYQYDLSRPSDQLRYEMDLGAQMRDELSVNPRRDLDRDLGQYGGGIRR